MAEDASGQLGKQSARSRLRFSGYLGLYAALAVAFLVAVAAVNYVVDPTQLFHAKAGLVDILLDGKHIADPGKFDHRNLQKAYIEQSETAHQIVVLGSSRSWQISSDVAGTSSFFNHGVPGATIEDYVALDQLLLENNLQPERVILVVDPWVFNKNSGQTRWRAISDAYRRAVDRLGPSDQPVQENKLTANLDKYRRLLSREYLVESLRQLRDDVSADYYVTEVDDLPVPVLRADGSLSYDRAFRQQPIEEVATYAESFANSDPVYSIGDFTEIDLDLQTLFDAFLEDLQNRGIQVTVLLVPYHPIVYSELIISDKYKIIAESESSIRDVSMKYGVALAGSYDPQVNGCGPEDFYDGMHPKVSCLSKLKFKTW
jgi:hypothetical protein